LWSHAFLDPFLLVDDIRRAQGKALGALGFGPDECDYEVTASGPLWRLRRYPGGDAGPVVLIVPAPIKRPYIWDLAPSASAVRYCLQQGLGVHLLEWRPPTRQDGAGGLCDYADGAISAAMDALVQEVGASKPFVMGHSLGGTLAAIFAAARPERLSGLVTLGAPLCFHPGVSAFRDSLVALTPPWLLETDIVPGSFLSQLSAMASPTTFVWSRLLDAAATAGNPRAAELRRRIECWALDEVPLSGRLVREILVWL
jgi:polyhydroxyalkanoate synthase